MPTYTCYFAFPQQAPAMITVVADSKLEAWKKLLYSLVQGEDTLKDFFLSEFRFMIDNMKKDRVSDIEKLLKLPVNETFDPKDMFKGCEKFEDDVHEFLLDAAENPFLFAGDCRFVIEKTTCIE